MKGGAFERIYEIVAQIPSGRVATYGQIARLAGNARMARTVGYALHSAPDWRNLPCHRVVNRFGQLSRVFESGGVNEQRILLELEGVSFSEDGCVPLEEFIWYGPEERGSCYE